MRRRGSRGGGGAGGGRWCAPRAAVRCAARRRRTGCRGTLAVDDRAAQGAFGVVVGRLDALVVGERPQRRPELEQVARHPARVPVAGLLAGVGAQERLELAAQRADATLELLAVAGVLVDLPAPEQLLADPQS